MTSDRFYSICADADKELEGKPLKLVILVDRDRNLERVVCIHGSWSGGCVTRRELYRPTPGRQGNDCYIGANEKCRKEEEKYKRWLGYYYDYLCLGGVA